MATPVFFADGEYTVMVGRETFSTAPDLLVSVFAGGANC
jgi:hypothetical protein